MRRAALLVVAVILAGCGGGGDRLTREEYASKADAICAKYKERVESVSASTAAALARAADRTLAAFEDATRDLRALKPPESEEELVQQWFAQLEVLKTDVEKIRDRARAGDLQGVRELAPLGLEHNRVANQLAERLGMRVCSQG